MRRSGHLPEQARGDLSQARTLQPLSNHAGDCSVRGIAVLELGALGHTTAPNPASLTMRPRPPLPQVVRGQGRSCGLGR